MKKLITLLALMCLMVTGAWADETFRAHRYDTFKVMPINENSIVFVGNSITDMQLWAEAFGDNPNVVNRGNSGATSSEILANVRSYCAGHPAKIFLMIGINDKPNGSNTTTIVNNIKATVEAIQAESPSTQIYVQSIMPCGNTGFSNNTYISQVNSAIQSMVGQKTGVTYIDVYTPLEGYLDQVGNYSYDKLHPTAASSQIWMETIKQYVNGTNRYPSNTASVMTKSTLGNDSFGARATCMSVMPITSNDILFFGDEMVKNGEWNELLRNANVKNRGTNWDYDKTVSSMTYCRGDINATFATVSGVSKTAPKQVLLYTGTGEVNGSTSINSLVSTYTGLVDLIRTYAPATSTKISLVGLMPTKGYDNSRVKQFNAALQTYAATATNVEYIDIYTALSTNDQINTQYFTADNYYLYGPGYIKVAEILADHIEGCNPVTAAQASAYRALVNGNNADEAFFEEGLYQIQVGSGTAQDHATYKDYYIYANQHQASGYNWAMGLTDDATNTATYVYISGSHDQWHIEFNHGTTSSYYAAQNGLASTTAGDLQFIPNSDASEWKIMGGANRYWMGWNLNGPSIGSASGTNLTDAQMNCYFVFKKVDEREADEKFFEEGWYKIQVGNGNAQNHADYSGKYLYANPHDYVVGTTTYKYAIGLADSGSDPTAYVYITGSHDQWHMEFNHGRDNSYFVTTNCLYDKTTPGNLKFIPNDETNPTQWKIWGSWPEAPAIQNQGDYRWIGWNLNGPSVGATSQIYDYNNNCYFVFTKTDAPVYPEEPTPSGEFPKTGVPYVLQESSGSLYLNVISDTEAGSEAGKKNVVLKSAPQVLYFSSQGTGFYIQNGDGLYVGKSTANGWNMSAGTPELWTVEPVGTGYALHCERGYLGFNDVTSGGTASAGFRDKAATARAIFNIKEAVNVTYNFYVNGQSIGSKVVAEVAGQVPTVSVPDYVNIVSGMPTTIVAGTTSYDVETSYKSSVPFTVGNTYFIDDWGVSGRHYLLYSNGANVKETKQQNVNVSTYKNNASYKWTVGGDWLNGFTFKNGEGYYMKAPNLNPTDGTALVVSTTDEALCHFDLKTSGAGSGKYTYTPHGGSNNFAHTSNKDLNLSFYSSYSGTNLEATTLTFIPVPVMPVNGKVYTIYNNHQGTKYYVKNTLTSGYSTVSTTFNGNDADKWIAWGDNTNGYQFINVANKQVMIGGYNGTVDTFFPVDNNILEGISLQLKGQNAYESGATTNLAGRTSSISNTSTYSTDFVFTSTGQYAYKVEGATGGQVTVGSTTYNVGDFCITTSELTDDQLQAAQGYAATLTDHVITLAQSGPSEELLALRDACDKIKNGALGYPTIEEVNGLNGTNAFLTFYTDYCSDSDATPADLLAATTAYIALLNSSPEVNMPELGHAFKLSVRSSDGTKHWYLTNSNTVSEDEADAAIFVMGSTSDTSNPYLFVTNDQTNSKYLCSNGATASTYNNQGKCDYSLSSMLHIVNTHIGGTPTLRVGSFAFQVKREALLGQADQVMIFKEDSEKLGSGTEAYMDGTYTSAIELEEVEYPYTEPKLVSGTGDGHEGVWASVWLPFPMNIPDGIEVYKGTQERTVKGEPYLGLTKVDPDTHSCYAKGGYLLYSTTVSAGPIDVLPANSVPTDARETDDAAFVGSTVNPGVAGTGDEWNDFSATFDGKTPYVLANKTPGVGFYKYVGTKMPKGKAIWLKPADSSDAECVKLGFDDIISAIEALHGNTTNAEIYDLQGHRLDKVEKGQINVINGQKIMFK